MATLNLKHFPDDLYQRLQQLAQSEHRSLAQQVIHLLDRATAPRRPLSILELRGLGRDCWEGIDASAHVAAERDSWDS